MTRRIRVPAKLTTLTAILSISSIVLLKLIFLSQREIRLECFNGQIAKQNVTEKFLKEIRSEEYIFETALKLNKIGGVNIVALSNYAYREITLNWIASLIKNDYYRFVIFSFDAELAVFLAERGFKRNAVILPKKWLGEYDVNFLQKISDWKTNTADLVNMVKARAKFWSQLLQHDITFLFCDLDLVFLSSHLLEHIQFMHANSQTEILLTQDQFGRKHIAYNTGFFYATPTPFVKKLFVELTDYIVKTGDTDQIGLQKLIAKSYKHDKRIDVLDHFLYPTGYVFSMNRLNEKLNVKPLMYHTNYYLTIGEKLDSLKKEGFWYVDEEGHQDC
jgi:hypothetical protein